MYSFASDISETDYFEIDPNTGQIFLSSKPITSPEKFEKPVTLIVRATQIDNSDKYAVTTLVVSTGNHVDHGNVEFVKKSYKVKVLESVPIDSVIASLMINRPQDRRMHYSISDHRIKEFRINKKGEIILK